MSTVIAGLFPGQGSQSVGMGAQFFEQSAAAKEIFAEADRVLGFALSELCLAGPLDRLTLTENAQPAILVVSFIAFKVSGINLNCAAGHSLGEYSALLAADCFDFAEAVQLVHKRGRYMQEAVAPGAGKMAAVMGPSAEEIKSVIAEVSPGTVEIANLNSPGQTVVAGDVTGVNAFAEKMAAKGGKIIPLNVSAPFHCSLMRPAAESLSRDLDAISFRAPQFPVYANVTAASGDDVRECLKKQVCSSVRWTECMLNMAETEKVTHTVEFGAGGVLTKLAKRIVPQIKRLEVSDPTGAANLAHSVS